MFVSEIICECREVIRQHEWFELCGQPAFVSAELETNLTWEDSQITWTNGRCVQQFHYLPPFSICGESWQIGFDERSNVVSKFHFISP